MKVIMVLFTGLLWAGECNMVLKKSGVYIKGEPIYIPYDKIFSVEISLSNILIKYGDEGFARTNKYCSSPDFDKLIEAIDGGRK